MIKYILAANTFPEPHHHNFENIRELDEEEIIRFFESVNVLTSFDRTFSLFEICEKNFITLEAYYKELRSITGFNQQTLHEVIINWNTFTLNYLDSFRLFNDHHEATLERKDDPVQSTYAKFKERTAIHYDKYFSYRFLWHLRDYIQHCGLPSCSWSFSEITEGPDKDKSQVNITYDRDGILKGFNWKKLTTELENQPSTMNVISLIRELHSSITDIAQFTAHLHIMKLQESYSLLTDLVIEVISKYPTAEPDLLKWKLEGELTTNARFMEIIPFPLRIMTNIRDMLPQ